MTSSKKPSADDTQESSGRQPDDEPAESAEVPKEIGGRPGPDPTRYGDWEKNGRCIDF